LYFYFTSYNQYVAVQNVCGTLPARVLPEAQQAGPLNAFQRSRVQLQQDGRDPIAANRETL
jgi:hypothetical protein